MPYRVERRDNKFRLVRADTGQIATNASGTALDGGGHATRQEAEAQQRAVESHENKKLRIEKR